MHFLIGHTVRFIIFGICQICAKQFFSVLFLGMNFCTNEAVNVYRITSVSILFAYGKCCTYTSGHLEYDTRLGIQALKHSNGH